MNRFVALQDQATGTGTSGYCAHGVVLLVFATVISLDNAAQQVALDICNTKLTYGSY